MQKRHGSEQGGERGGAVPAAYRRRGERCGERRGAARRTVRRAARRAGRHSEESGSAKRGASAAKSARVRGHAGAWGARAGTRGLVDDVRGHDRPEVLVRGGEGPRTSGKARLTELFGPLGDESEPSSPDRVYAGEMRHPCFRLGSQGTSAAVSAPQRRKAVTSGIGTGSCRRRSRRHPARPRCGAAGCTWPRGRCGRGRRS